MSDYQPNEAEKLLIAALRSGKYEQANGQLRSGGRFCCLGVACDVFRKKKRSGRWRGNSFYVDKINAHDSGLPAVVQGWLGWTDDMGKLSRGTYRGNWMLAHENDDGVPFSEIADIIERGEVLRAEPSK